MAIPGQCLLFEWSVSSNTCHSFNDFVIGMVCLHVLVDAPTLFVVNPSNI